MGRHRKVDITQFVSYDTEKNESSCRNCGKILKGNSAGNITRHYKLLHNYKENPSENVEENANETVSAKRSRKSQIKIEIDKNEFLKCCVGLVTVKSIPFRIFDDEQYFKKLIKPYEELFGTNLNAKNILDHVSKVSHKIKNIISKSVKNKMISLKIDVATRMEKSILGINIQYIKNFKVNINTIGMIELKRRHTAEFLKEEILKCLSDFNISVNQIYSTTTDNGANVLKASKLLKDLQEEQIGFRANEHPADVFEDSEDEYEQIQEQLEKVTILAVIRCAAHTIQLAAHDVLKKFQQQVDECRRAVKALRVLARGGENFKMPVLDNATRWNSTFEMINSLFLLKENIENNDYLSNLPEINWTFIQNFMKAFKPLSECTKKFQSVHYILGDFYRDWLCCEIQLEEIQDDNEYAKLLLSSMIQRRSNLMANNKALVSALYLDPRFNFANSPFLTDEQKKEAIKHVLYTSRAIKELCGEFGNDSISASTQSSTGSTHVPSTSAAAGLYAKLENKMLRTLGNNVSLEQRTLQQKLENLAYRERCSFDIDVLQYWEDFSSKDKEIGKLAEVVLAVPSSQASVERAFSALSVILTRNRCKLSKDTINKVLLVKLNGNILKELVIDDIE